MAQVNFRIDDDVKARAESACAAMGLTMSAAINIFLTKVANERRIPFEISAVPANRSLDISKMSDAELSKELEKGYSDIQAGRTKPAEEVFANIRKD